MRAWGVKEVHEDIQTREGGEKRLELCCTGKSAVARCVRGEMGKNGPLKTYLFKKKNAITMGLERWLSSCFSRGGPRFYSQGI